MIKQSKKAWPTALMLKGIFITGTITLLFSMSGRADNAMAQGIERTSPPISCAGCHSFQAKLFKDYTSHHPNNLTINLQTDPWTRTEAIKDDCKVCHLFDPKKHTRGLVLLKDPDLTDSFSYDGDPMNKRNMCLSCHDKPKNPTSPIKFFSVGGYPPEVASTWASSAHGISTIPNTNILIDCLDCHKYHGSSFAGLRKLEDEDLCYTCHDEAQEDFDPGFTSHHHLEPILVDTQFQDVLDCTSCHNPHLVTREKPLNRPGLTTELYLALPTSVATATITDTATGLLISGTPYFTGQVNDSGTPFNNLFCMECHAPNLFMEPRSPWPGAPNISYELTNRDYAALGTVSNFYYEHNHVQSGGGGVCAECHITGGGGGGGGGAGGTVAIYRTFNGHYTHKDNASCTYCHDPHGTKGTFAGLTESGDIGVQRGHLLKDWLFVDSRYANPVPAYGGYNGDEPNSNRSCLANDPFNSCHSVSYVHESDVRPLNTTTFPDSRCFNSCHVDFKPILARTLEETEEDNIAPGSPG